jgi:hypothetical protein
MATRSTVAGAAPPVRSPTAARRGRRGLIVIVRERRSIALTARRLAGRRRQAGCLTGSVRAGVSMGRAGFTSVRRCLRETLVSASRASNSQASPRISDARSLPRHPGPY